MYIYLRRKDDLDTRIDIRYGGVEDFIEDNKPQTILHAPADSETGLAVLVTADGLISDLPLFAVPYENALDYNRLPVVNVSGNAVVRLIGFDGDTLRIGEDYYENRGDITFIQQRTQTLTVDDDGAFVLSIEHRNPNRDESAVYYVAADNVRYCFKVQFVSEEEWFVQPLENDTVDS